MASVAWLDFGAKVRAGMTYRESEKQSEVRQPIGELLGREVEYAAG